jgi:hypothetical protein
MTEAQLGLLAGAAIIIAFTLAMRRVGALQTAGTAAALATTITIAVALYLTQ